MENRLFTNERILAWLQYFCDNTEIDLERVKMLDITRKNKNLIPTIESNKAVMVFTDNNQPDIFYKMWEIGLGECEVWYNEGDQPTGPIKHDKLKDMINRGIGANAGMLVVNPNARTSYKIGMDNSSFSRGSVQYVGSEIRSVILNKMHIDQGDTLCVISGASIAVESAILAPEGSVIAVEYSGSDRKTLGDNAHQFGLNNITIIDRVSDDTMKDLPVPGLAMLVASASMEQEIECLLRLNPHMEFVVYTLDFPCAASMPALFEKYGIGEVEVIQISVSKLNAKRQMVSEPAPWIISGKALPSKV